MRSKRNASSSNGELDSTRSDLIFTSEIRAPSRDSREAFFLRWRDCGRAAVFSAGGAVDPGGCAAGVVFLFPDREPRLRLVDDIAARVKGGASMFGRHAHPHR